MSGQFDLVAHLYAQLAFTARTFGTGRGTGEIIAGVEAAAAPGEAAEQ